MRFAVPIVLIAISFSGCGKRLAVAPASGIVTLDGKPWANAHITTQPLATESRTPGPGSFGRTDAQGRFELELVNPAMKGAIIGEHRVMISPAAGETANAAAQRTADGKLQWSDARQPPAAEAAKWPVSFGDGSLRMTVPPEGTDKVRFDLKQSQTDGQSS